MNRVYYGLDDWAVAVISNLVCDRKRKGTWPEMHTSTYGRIEQTAESWPIGNDSWFRTLWLSDWAPEKRLNGIKSSKALLQISRTVADIWLLPSVRNMDISVEYRRLLAYVTDTLRSGPKCYFGQTQNYSYLGLIQLRRKTNTFLERIITAKYYQKTMKMNDVLWLPVD